MKPEGVVSQCTWLPIFCYHHDHHDHHDRHDNLVPSECPGAKLHNAGLLVEREVGHIYRTGRLQKIVFIIVYHLLFYCHHITIPLVTVIRFAFERNNSVMYKYTFARLSFLLWMTKD